jgi:hypothetical protein
MIKKLLALAVIGMMAGCMETVSVKGTVMSHDLVADKHGYRKYCTLIKTDDGQVIESTMRQNYILPIGTRVTIKVIK